MRARPICVQKFVDHFQCPAALLPGRTHQATTATNCNENGVPDECDIAGGTSSDTNQNGVPDECEEILVPYRVEYGYDYMGRRVRRQSFEWDAAGAAWVGPMMDTKYVYDGWRVIEELNGVDPVNPDATTRQYTWGLDLAAQAGAVNSLEQAGGIGGLLALRSTSADYGAERSAIYFYDANGNVAQVVTITAPWYGEIYAHYEYTPYGQVLVEPLFDQPYRFSTKPFDSWTGLGYWGYRWYSPKTGRWVNRDPIGENVGFSLTSGGDVNLYQFVMNRPSVLRDALGDCPNVDPADIIWQATLQAHDDYFLWVNKRLKVAFDYSVSVPRKAFRDACCTKVGLVQITKERYHLGRAGDWRLDGRPWYRHVTGPNPVTARTMSGHDGPGWMPKTRPGGANDVQFNMWFETCAVCVDSNNKIVCPLSCIQWSFWYQQLVFLDPRPAGVHKLWLTVGQRETHAVPRKGNPDNWPLLQDSPAGKAASDAFWKAIKPYRR